MRTRLGRRTLLRGAGVALALPPLEAMFGGSSPAAAAVPGEAESFVLFHFPNGADMDDWVPNDEGVVGTFGEQMQPLVAAGHAEAFSVVSGLSSTAGTTPGSQFGSAHSVPVLNFTTGTLADEVSKATSISVDQEIAAMFTGTTPLPYMVMAPYRERGAAGQKAISWAGAGNPILPADDPVEIFAQMFATELEGPQQEEILARRLSILDYVERDIADLDGRLGAKDRERLDDHLTAIRTLEQSLQAFGSCEEPAEGPPMIGSSDAEIDARADALVDVGVMALRCNVTRVLNFSMGHTITVATYPFLDAPENDHRTSHYRSVTEEQEPDPDIRRELNLHYYREVTAWKIGKFARLLSRLAETQLEDGSLLDRTFVVCASEIGWGGEHLPYNLPVLVAGAGIAGGRHIHVPCTVPSDAENAWKNNAGPWCSDGGGNTPLANLWLTAIAALGGAHEAFGDSTGTLDQLW